MDHCIRTFLISAVGMINEVQQIYIWILGGVLTFLITIGTLIISAYFASLGKKIEALTVSIQDLTNNNTKQTEQITALFTDKTVVQERLNEHGKRIRQIELTCAERAPKRTGVR